MREGDIEDIMRKRNLMGLSEAREATRNRPTKIIRDKEGNDIYYKNDDKGRVTITAPD